MFTLWASDDHKRFLLGCGFLSMTRMQKALEKAAGSQPAEIPGGAEGPSRDMSHDHGALGIKSFAEGVEPVDRPPSASHPVATHPPAVFPEPLPVTHSAPVKSHTLTGTRAMRCPECGSVYEGTLRGAWATKVLGLMRILPYRCNYCRRRFELADAYPKERETVSIFLQPEDDRSFHDLIRELARDERQQAAHGFGLNAAPMNERGGRR